MSNLEGYVDLESLKSKEGQSGNHIAYKIIHRSTRTSSVTILTAALVMIAALL